MKTAIDTNVIASVLSGEEHAKQIINLLKQKAIDGPLVICGVVHAELAAHPRGTESLLQEFLTETWIQVDWEVGEDVWLAAGHGFAQYVQRRRKFESIEKRLLADFIVGAHAVLHADCLFTLDHRTFRTYFPGLNLLRLEPFA